MSAIRVRCHDNEYLDDGLSNCAPCRHICWEILLRDCKRHCPEYYEKYHGSGSTIAPATTSVPLDSQASPWRLLPFFTGVTTVILFCSVLALGWIIYRRKRKTIRQKKIFTEPTTEADAEGNSGRAKFSHSSTRGATIKLLSEAEQHPDHTYNLPADEKPLLMTRNGIEVARGICGLDTGHRSNTSSETHIGPPTGVTPPHNQAPGNGTSVTSHDNQASANGTSVTSHDNQAPANGRPPTSVTSHDNQASSNGTSVTSHDNQAPGNGTSVTSHENQASANARPPTSVTSHDSQASANARPPTSMTPHDNQASSNVDLLNRVTSPDHHENANPGVPTSRAPYDRQGVASSVPPVSVTPARNQSNGNTGPSANIDLHRVNQGTASGGPPSLGELAQNPASDHVVLPTSRPGDFGMSHDPTPMNPVSSLRESPGLIQNPVQASSEPPSDIPGSGIPSLHLQVYGAFPPEVADRWGDLSLHSDQELNLNLVSDEEDLDPLSGDPGSLQLDLRSGIEYAPEPQAADNMDHWVVVEQMSGTGGVSTGAVLRGCERIEEHAIHMPWVRGCFKTGHKLGIYTERGERSEEAMRQQALDVTGLPRQALVLSHQHWLNHPAPGPGPYPPQESIDSLFGDSGPA